MTTTMRRDTLVTEINKVVDALKPSLKPVSRKKITKMIDEVQVCDRAKQIAALAVDAAFADAAAKGSDKVYAHAVSGHLEIISLRYRAGLID